MTADPGFFVYIEMNLAGSWSVRGHNCDGTRSGTLPAFSNFSLWTMCRNNAGPSEVGTKRPSKGAALPCEAGEELSSSSSSAQHSQLQPCRLCSTLLFLWKPANLNSECNISWCVCSDRRVLGVYLFSNVKPWSATQFCLCWCIISCQYSVFYLFLQTIL